MFGRRRAALEDVAGQPSMGSALQGVATILQRPSRCSDGGAQHRKTSQGSRAWARLYKGWRSSSSARADARAAVRSTGRRRRAAEHGLGATRVGDHPAAPEPMFGRRRAALEDVAGQPSMGSALQGVATILQRPSRCSDGGAQHRKTSQGSRALARRYKGRRPSCSARADVRTAARSAGTCCAWPYNAGRSATSNQLLNGVRPCRGRGAVTCNPASVSVACSTFGSG